MPTNIITSIHIVVENGCIVLEASSFLNLNLVSMARCRAQSHLCFELIKPIRHCFCHVETSLIRYPYRLFVRARSSKTKGVAWSGSRLAKFCVRYLGSIKYWAVQSSTFCQGSWLRCSISAVCSSALRKSGLYEKSGVLASGFLRAIGSSPELFSPITIKLS